MMASLSFSSIALQVRENDDEQSCCSLSLFYGLVVMKKTTMLSLSSFFSFFVVMTIVLSLSSLLFCRYKKMTMNNCNAHRH